MSVNGSAAKAAKRPGCSWQIAESPSLTRRHSGPDTSSGWASIQQNEPSSDSTLVSTPWRSIRARWKSTSSKASASGSSPIRGAFSTSTPSGLRSDARFPGAGAQGVGDFGGPPMGMHVDHGCHGCFLHGLGRQLNPTAARCKVATTEDRSPCTIRRTRRGTGSCRRRKDRDDPRCWCRLPGGLRGQPFPPQFFHAGADCFEIVGYSGL